MDGGNALLYAYRGIAHLRVGSFDQTAADLNTAERLGPATWAFPPYFNSAPGPEAAVQALERVTTLRPDDWFAYFMWGMMFYADLNRMEDSKALLGKSAALGPEANLPYITLTQIALREGRIADAQALARRALAEYPDPGLTNRALNALYGSPEESMQFSGLYFSAATNTILGQYAQVIDEIEAVETALANLPGNIETIIPADMYFFQGLAYCNLGETAEAEDAYGNALQYSDDFALVYALRGQMRQALGQDDGAAADFAAAQTRDRAAAFDPWLAAAVAGDWTCANFFDYAPGP